MKNKPLCLLMILLIAIYIYPCHSYSAETFSPKTQAIIKKYTGIAPRLWGEQVSGVCTKLVTNEKVLALTFDACGGSKRSNAYDAKLIEYLKAKQIPATLFISGRWMKANLSTCKQLAQNSLFEIENHGLNHRPCSVNGRFAYGIKGTTSLNELVTEVLSNGKQISTITGSLPRFYRSGTNYYDEVATAVIHDLGYTPIGYQVLGDAGATFKRQQVYKALISAPPGSIIILHMNHPEGQTSEGLMDAIPKLEKLGFRFVKLSDYSMQ